MKCEECLRLLHLYLDRELTRDARFDVSEHLMSCENCQATYQSLEEENAFFLENSPAIDPSPAFWSRVSQETHGLSKSSPSTSRLNPFETFVRWLGSMRIGPVLTASIVVCSIALTTLVSHLINQKRQANPSPVASQGETTPPALATTVSPTSAGSLKSPTPQRKPEARRSPHSMVTRNASADELVRDAERKYLEAIAMLSRDANRKRSRTDPEQLIQFDHALAAVDRTIAGTRRAVREHPRDPVAVQYMLTAYAKKVDVLRQMLSD